MTPTTIGAGSVASWWGYATADSTLVGVLVVTVAVLAVAYVVQKMARQRGAGTSSNAKKTSGR